MESSLFLKVHSLYLFRIYLYFTWQFRKYYAYLDYISIAFFETQCLHLRSTQLASQIQQVIGVHSSVSLCKRQWVLDSHRDAFITSLCLFKTNWLVHILPCSFFFWTFIMGTVLEMKPLQRWYVVETGAGWLNRLVDELTTAFRFSTSWF